MRIFFSADVHGSTLVWKKWLKVVDMYHPDVMMFCGDLTAKSLVPIIQTKDGYTCHYFEKRWDLAKEDDVQKMEERLAAVGVLSLRCTPEEVEELQRDETKAMRAIYDGILARMKQWLDLLVERVDTQKRVVIVMPGNDDIQEIDALIKSYEDRGVIYPLGRVVQFSGYELVSLAHITPSPWDTPREMSEKELHREIDRLMEGVNNSRRAIFNFHIPPYGTSLDQAPELTKDLRIKSVAGQISLKHVGSKSVREAIEKYHPLLGLHGHIHESDGIEKMGDTLILNPGSEYEKGILRGYIIELNEGKIDDCWRISG